MKNIILIISIFICLIFVSGCSSNTYDKDFYIDVQDYIELNGNKCIEYIEQDKTMTNREKQKYRIRHRYIQTLLKNKLINE